jgi:hypothetical protein
MKQIQLCVTVVSNSNLQYSRRPQDNHIQQKALYPKREPFRPGYPRQARFSYSEPAFTHETNEEMYRGYERFGP